MTKLKEKKNEIPATRSQFSRISSISRDFSFRARLAPIRAVFHKKGAFANIPLPRPEVTRPSQHAGSKKSASRERERTWNSVQYLSNYNMDTYAPLSQRVCAPRARTRVRTSVCIYIRRESKYSRYNIYRRTCIWPDIFSPRALSTIHRYNAGMYRYRYINRVLESRGYSASDVCLAIRYGPRLGRIFLQLSFSFSSPSSPVRCAHTHMRLTRTHIYTDARASYRARGRFSQGGRKKTFSHPSSLAFSARISRRKTDKWILDIDKSSRAFPINFSRIAAERRAATA